MGNAAVRLACTIGMILATALPVAALDPSNSELGDNPPVFKRDPSGRILSVLVPRESTLRAVRVAIDSMRAHGGGPVRIAPGTFEIHDSPLELPARVTVEGVGARPVIFRLSAEGPNRIFDVRDTEGVRLSRVHLDASYHTRTPGTNAYGVHVSGSVEGLVVEDCTFRNATHAIRVERRARVNGLRILRNDIQVQDRRPGSAGHIATGIFVHDESTTKAALIEGNEITGDAGGAHATSGGGAAIYFGGDRGRIAENWIHDYSAGAGRSNGFSKGGIGILIVAGGVGNVIEGNVFEDVHGDNISVRGTTTRVLFNEIRGSHDQGIVLEDATDAEVFGNRVLGCETPAVRVLNSSDVRIVSNELRDGATDPTMPGTLQAIVALANGPRPGERISTILVDGNVLISANPLRFGIHVAPVTAEDHETTAISIGSNGFFGDFGENVGWGASVRAIRPPAEPFRIDGVSPHPVRDSASLSFTVPNASAVRVDVYDVAGRLVATMLNEVVPAGSHSREWALPRSRGIPSGVYFLRAQSGGTITTRKLSIVR